MDSGNPDRHRNFTEETQFDDRLTGAQEGGQLVIPLLLFLVLVALLFGLGAAIHLVWIVALVALVLWMVGFLFRPKGGRWFYW
jgi:hypothetical protein